MTTLSGRLRSNWSRYYAEWLVILVVIVALAAGWAVKTYAENRTLSYVGDGVHLAYPFGWTASKASEGTLRFKDMYSSGTPVAIEVDSLKASDQAGPQALTTQADGLAMTRGRDLTAYRTLDSESTTYRGQPALRVSYVFVQEKGNAFQQHLPVVMLGEDFLTYQQGRVYIFTLQAPQDRFAEAQRHFEALLRSAAFGS